MSFNLKPLIYTYFEQVPNEPPNVDNNQITTWQCKSDWCKKKFAFLVALIQI